MSLRNYIHPLWQCMWVPLTIASCHHHPQWHWRWFDFHLVDVPPFLLPRPPLQQCFSLSKHIWQTHNFPMRCQVVEIWHFTWDIILGITCYSKCNFSHWFDIECDTIFLIIIFIHKELFHAYIGVFQQVIGIILKKI